MQERRVIVRGINRGHGQQTNRGHEVRFKLGLMPWKSELPMEQRRRYIRLIISGHFTIIINCEHLKVSRESGHKWIGRYRKFVSIGLEDRSRSPVKTPDRTAPNVERLIIDLKNEGCQLGSQRRSGKVTKSNILTRECRQ